MCADLVLDGCGGAGLRGGGWRPVLQQGHRVGAVAQRRSLNLEDQLVDGEASLLPHLLSGAGHRNHLEQRQGDAVTLFINC